MTPILLVWLLACRSPPPAPPADATESEPVPAIEPAPTVPPLPDEGPFQRELAPGLVLAAHDPPDIPDEGFSRPKADAVEAIDRRIFVVTIDPAHFELVLLSSLDPALGASAVEASAWAARHDLQVAWNPGMFEPDSRPTGHTRAGAFVSQAGVRRQSLYRSFFVAEPASGGPPAVLDRVPPAGEGRYAPGSALPADFRARLEGYGVVSQSLPILRDGVAAYPARKNQWSELAYGVDDAGRVLVVFSRYPYEMRELGRRIEAMGIGARALIHGEGGPEATLVVRAGGIELIAVGSYETGFYDDSNRREWVLPAVMGVRPRAARSGRNDIGGL